MIAGDKPRTVDEAELAGWLGLQIDCDACRIITQVAWPMIRRRSGYRVLREIKERLVCRKCRHKPQTVELYRIEHHGRGSPSTETMGI